MIFKFDKKYTSHKNIKLKSATISATKDFVPMDRGATTFTSNNRKKIPVMMV